MLRTKIELFEITAISSHDEDAGWYFQMKIGKKDVGEPSGPFPTPQAASIAAAQEAND